MMKRFDPVDHDDFGYDCMGFMAETELGDWVSYEDAEAEIEALKDKIETITKQRDRMYDDMLLWRGIDRDGGDTPCKACSGAGVRAYGDTATWRGGIGGQVITNDICDKCWGSGKAKKPWLNLRRLSRQQRKDRSIHRLKRNQA